MTIEVRDVVHRYGDLEALAGVSLEVAPGEIFGVLGPNGSGKSTLFKILSTLITPTGGEVRVDGVELASDPDGVRSRIGVAFQSPSLDAKLSCRENLIHRGHLYGLSGRELGERADALLAGFDMADRAGDRVENLSGGLRRRVELAASMLHGPKVLLLDEPATGLDPGARRELWDDLNRLRDADGVTIALTTHLMEEADRCDRLAIFDRGKVVALGTPEELRSEVGSEVLDILPVAGTRDALEARLRDSLGLDPRVVDGHLRIEPEDGHRTLVKLVTELGDDVDSIRSGKPTLGDVFLHRTGRAFREEAVDESAAKAGSRRGRRSGRGGKDGESHR